MGDIELVWREKQCCRSTTDTDQTIEMNGVRQFLEQISLQLTLDSNGACRTNVLQLKSTIGIGVATRLSIDRHLNIGQGNQCLLQDERQHDRHPDR